MRCWAEASPTASPAVVARGGPAAPTDFAEFLAGLPVGLRERVAVWREHPRFLALRDESRQRLVRLLARTTAWIREGLVSEDAGVRLADWIEPLLRRESYLALLLERPTVHQRLLRLLGNARWPARYLLLHPGVIDELANDTMLAERFEPQEFERELVHRRSALADTGEDDDEALLNLLRRAHHAEVFRTLARDVEGRLTVEQVADDLSALAQCILRVTTQLVLGTHAQPAPRGPAIRHRRLRQAGRQGAGLRQRPGHRVRLRRPG
jgi:glutamate-ammonia-ligase adenylyltransferase